MVRGGILTLWAPEHSGRSGSTWWVQAGDFQGGGRRWEGAWCRLGVLGWLRGVDEVGGMDLTSLLTLLPRSGL